MKIALYGMPCAGKSTLMDRITDAKVINGSQELRRICGGSFLELSEEEKHQVRIKYTEYINGLNDEVIVSDGHYSFMETVAFTETDGELYDIFIYLYCSPENLKERYALSEKNGKFAGESIESLRQWQEFEINNLREECHRRNKDFYVVSDNEEEQNREMIPLEGDIPSPVHPPKGCKFHTRCKYCTEICKHITPELVEMRPGHFVACHNPLGVEKDS